MLAEVNRGAAYLVASIIGLIGTLATLSSGSMIGFLLILIGPTLAVLIHELGHALAAWSVGMAVRTIAVGPFELRFNPMRFGLAERLLGTDVGGHVLYDESRGRYLTRAADRIIIAAGPLANFAAAAIPYTLANFIDHDTVVRIFVGFAFMNFAAFVVSAWPVKMRSGRGNDALQ